MDIQDIKGRFGASKNVSSDDAPTRMAVGYVRVSTEHQEDKGCSLQAQRAAIEQYAERNSIELLEIYEEAKSGFQDDHRRVEFHRMVEHAKSDVRISIVLVHDYSRFSRDSLRARMLVNELRNEGIRIVSLNDVEVDPDSVAGVYMEAITFAKNEAYSREVAFHTRKGMRQNIQQRDAATGYCYKNGGQPMLGYKPQRVQIGVERNGQPIFKTIWVLNEEIVSGKPIHQWAREVLDMALRGASLDRIRDFLNNSGVPAPRSRYWGTSTIHSMLETNCLLQYAGYAVWNVRGKKRRRNPIEQWEIVENGQPAIITDDEMMQIHEARRKYEGLGHSEFNAMARSNSSKYLLSGGLFTCRRCGKNMIGFRGQNGKGFSAEYYACGSARYRRGLGCGQAKYVRKQTVEDRIIAQIAKRLEEWQDIDLFKKLCEEHKKQASGRHATQRDSLQKHSNEIDKKIAGIRQAILDGLDDIQWANTQLHSLKAEKQSVESKLRQLPAEEAEVTLNLNAIKQAFHRFSEVTACGTNTEKRDIIRKFVSQIQIEPDSGEIIVLFREIPADFVIQLGAGRKLIPNFHHS